MKGVPIKFRGRNGIGEYVYGYYVPWHLCSEVLRAATVGQCRALNEPWTDKAGLIDKDGCTAIVEADSVAQLVGYDAAGNELYEGDGVHCYHSFQASAENLAKSEKYTTGRVRLVAVVDGGSFPSREDLDSDDYQYLIDCVYGRRSYRQNYGNSRRVKVK